MPTHKGENTHARTHPPTHPHTHPTPTHAHAHAHTHAHTRHKQQQNNSQVLGNRINGTWHATIHVAQMLDMDECSNDFYRLYLLVSAAQS
jgi:hypothetical protein